MAAPAILASWFGGDVASESPAILLIHGFPLGRTLWRLQDGAFDPSRTIIPELPGFGSRKSAPLSPTIESYSRDMIAELDARGIDRALVCGLSMGGYVALDVYRRFPDRVLALGLISTRAEADTVEGKRGRDDMMAMVRDRGLTPLADAMVPKLVAETASAEVQAETRAMILASSVPGILNALAAMRDRVDSRPLLPQINVPTLVVAGADDRLIPVSSSQLIANGITGAKLAIVPGAGHLVPLEKPNEFNREVQRFLATLS